MNSLSKLLAAPYCWFFFSIALLPTSAANGQHLSGEIGGGLVMSQDGIRDHYGITGGVRVGLFLRPFDGIPLYLGPRFGFGFMGKVKETDTGDPKLVVLRAVSVSDAIFVLRLSPKFGNMGAYVEGVLGEFTLKSHNGVRLKVAAFGRPAGAEVFFSDYFYSRVPCYGIGAGFVVDNLAFEVMYLVGGNAEVVTGGYIDRNEFVTEQKKASIVMFQVLWWIGF